MEEFEAVLMFVLGYVMSNIWKKYLLQSFRYWILDISKEIGRYEVPMHVSLLGLGIGMMLASFHICGIMI